MKRCVLLAGVGARVAVRAAGALGVIGAMGIGAARAAVVVIPNVCATSEGAASSVAPFDVGEAGGQQPYAYQQVYMASAFSPATRQIDAIAFRADNVAGHAFNATLPNITIQLSTTQVTSTTMSATFASNVGPDAVTVQSGPLTLSSAFTPTGFGTRAFDIIIPLATPFNYNPANGNLLMDVRNPSLTSTCQFDFHLIDSQVGRAYAFSADAATAAAVDPERGLVTQFTVTLVPAPCAGLVPLIGLAAVRRRR